MKKNEYKKCLKKIGKQIFMREYRKNHSNNALKKNR